MKPMQPVFLLAMLIFAPLCQANDFPTATRVEFVLEEVPGGTALTVVETPSLAVGEMIPMVEPVILARSMPDPIGAPPRIMAFSG